MSEDKEAEKAARGYATGYGHGATIPKKMHQDIRYGLELVKHVAFLAGVEWERMRKKDGLVASAMKRQGLAVKPDDIELNAISGKRFEDDV